MMNRIRSKTPSFFRKLRNIGVALGIIGGAIMTAPITLPAAVVSAAGYLVTVGIVTAAVSQATKQQDE